MGPLNSYILPPTVNVNIEINTLTSAAQMRCTHELPANFLAVVFAQLIQQILTLQAQQIKSETQRVMDQAKPGNGSQS